MAPAVDASHSEAAPHDGLQRSSSIGWASHAIQNPPLYIFWAHQRQAAVARRQLGRATSRVPLCERKLNCSACDGVFKTVGKILGLRTLCPVP